MARQWFKVRELDNKDGDPWAPIRYDLNVGYYRHPPVNPDTGGEPDAGSNENNPDQYICMGLMRHCDAPGPHRDENCTHLMDDHGWIDNGHENPNGTMGTTVCPGMWVED